MVPRTGEITGSALHAQVDASRQAAAGRPDERYEKVGRGGQNMPDGALQSEARRNGNLLRNDQTGNWADGALRMSGGVARDATG